MWKDVPAVHGLPKTLYNRWKCRIRIGVFARIMTGLAAESQDTERNMINATHHQCHAPECAIVQGEARTWYASVSAVATLWAATVLCGAN